MSILIGNTYYTNISPVMTGDSSPSPYVTECSIVCINKFYKALDGDIDSYLRTNIQTVTPFTISLDYGEGNEKIVSAYILDCHQNVSWTMKSWNFEGSNDNNTWDILDSRSNISWNENAIQNFAFNNSTKYRYYRFNVLEKNGTNSVCINEVELLQEDPSTNLEFRKVRKNNLPSSKTDGIDTVYFTEDGEMYITDKNGNLKQSCGTKISTDSNNAIKAKTDGLFVQDLSDKINQINFAQKTVNEVGSVSLLEEPYSFTTTKATTVGSAVDKELKTTLTLKEDITNFDYIEILLTPNGTQRKRPAQITRCRVNTIAFNNSTTMDMADGSLIRIPFDVESTTASSFGVMHFSMDAWFIDSRTFYAYKFQNPSSSEYWVDFEITDIIGVKDRSIVIDPLEYVNSSSGIEDTPVGHIISFMGNTAPKHYLACDGAEYNITDYPHLTQHFIDQFGTANYFGGDGTTTFAVPGKPINASVLKLNPTMTSNTTPEGQVIYNNLFEDFKPYMVFGDSNSTSEKDCYVAHAKPSYLGYKFANPTIITAYSLQPRGHLDRNTISGTPSDWELQASNDMKNWVTLDTRSGITWTSTSDVQVFCFNNTTAYQAYRIYATNSANTDSFIIIGNLKFGIPETKEASYIKYEPTYFMKNTYSADKVYSTDEQVVGRWIDGKLLYRKTVEFTVASESDNDGSSSITIFGNSVTQYNRRISLSDAETVTKMNAIVRFSTGNINVIPQYYNDSSAGNIWYDGSNSQVVIRCTNSYSGNSGYLTVEYTKTTDSTAS